jgi:hypothetical protein
MFIEYCTVIIVYRSLLGMYNKCVNVYRAYEISHFPISFSCLVPGTFPLRSERQASTSGISSIEIECQIVR